MFLNSNLFSKGIPTSAEPGLSSVLEERRRCIVEKIRKISDLAQMTDSFLEQLVKDSLIEPLVIQFDRMTRNYRTEKVGRSATPDNSMAGPMLASGRFDDENEGVVCKDVINRMVARMSIPFIGDPTLLEYAPNPCGMTFPKGEVIGKTVQFDVILWDTPDDTQREKADIQLNCGQLSSCAAIINKQIKAFNKSLTAQVESAFAAKRDELTKQHAIFDDPGIAEQPEPPILPEQSDQPSSQDVEL